MTLSGYIFSSLNGGYKKSKYIHNEENIKNNRLWIQKLPSHVLPGSGPGWRDVDEHNIFETIEHTVIQSCSLIDHIVIKRRALSKPKVDCNSTYQTKPKKYLGQGLGGGMLMSTTFLKLLSTQLYNIVH